MAMPELTSCQDASSTEDSALSPFYALNYHFGMLLGVDDFATEQAHHRGKLQLHNGWLHGEGVAWGFNVTLDMERGEVRVAPGLALDAAGHEVHLEGEACLNAGEWFRVHRTDPDIVITEISPTIRQFDARVEIRHKTCLTRQVPSLMEPCTGGSGTAYSRVFETVDIRMVAGLSEERPPGPYHRLRVLMGLEEGTLPDDQEVIDRRTGILALPSGEQIAAYVDALREMAALDGIDLKPPESPDGSTATLFAAENAPPVLLADLSGIQVERTSPEGEEEQWRLVAGTVDVTVRLSHIATSTIQELLCGPALQDIGVSGAQTGPRVVPDSVQVSDTEIQFDVDADLAPAAVRLEAFSASTFDEAAGWTTHTVSGASVSADNRTVTVTLQSALPTPAMLRFIAAGRGPTPILGANLLPLEGRVGGPAAITGHGVDFVFMHQRS
jgi:hypothetical protein